MITTPRMIGGALLLMASASLALAQSSGTPSGTTGGASTAAPSRPAPPTGATGGASSTLNPPSGTQPTQGAPTGPGVSGTLPIGPSTTGQADTSSRPCNPAAVGATGGGFGTVTTVPPDSRTAIASERTGPTNPSNTGANLNPGPGVGGANNVSPGC